MNKAVFLDRDGTIIKADVYPSRVSDVELLPGVADGIRLLKGSGFKVFAATNQRAVSAGVLSHGQLKEIHNRLKYLLSEGGVAIDGIYYCPHQTEENCKCRKPEPGMLIAAAKEHGIDLGRSYMVGNEPKDCEAGRRAGCVSIGLGGHFDLSAAASWILEAESLSHEKIIQDFSGRKIAVLGDVMLDEWIFGTAERISPEAPVPVVGVYRKVSTLGGAGNAARHLAGLGAGVRLVGVMGKNGPAIDVMKLAEEAGIQAQGLLGAEYRTTTVKRRTFAHGQQIMREDREIAEPVCGEVEEELIRNSLQALEHSDGILVSDYGKGTVSINVIQSVIDKALATNKWVVVDPKGTDFGKYIGCSLVKPNALEATKATKTSQGSCFMAGKIMLQDLSCEAVAITLGADGISLFLKDGASFHFPGERLTERNIIGAGDVVAAILATGRGGLSIPWSGTTMLANRAGGLSVTKIGEGVVSAGELIRYCRNRLTDVDKGSYHATG